MQIIDDQPLPGGAWHPFRRRWATERKHLSPKDVAAVGGWVDTATLQKCYQVADEETMETVVLQPRRLRKMGQGRFTTTYRNFSVLPGMIPRANLDQSAPRLLGGRRRAPRREEID